MSENQSNNRFVVGVTYTETYSMAVEVTGVDANESALSVGRYMMDLSLLDPGTHVLATESGNKEFRILTHDMEDVDLTVDRVIPVDEYKASLPVEPASPNTTRSTAKVGRVNGTGTFLSDSELKAILLTLAEANAPKPEPGTVLGDALIRFTSAPELSERMEEAEMAEWCEEQRRNRDRLTTRQKMLLESIPGWTWGSDEQA